MSNEDRSGSVHNRAEGGHHHTIIQAGEIARLEVHGAAAARDERSDIEDPIIATVDLPSLGGLVVDADPPTAVMKSGESHVITLEARPVRAVVLRAMRPVVLSRRLPRPLRQGYHALQMRPRGFTVDLDADPPRLSSTEDGVDFPFTISATDVEQFCLLPSARREEVCWQLELDWTCAGHRGTTVINDNGKPFELYPQENWHKMSLQDEFEQTHAKAAALHTTPGRFQSALHGLYMQATIGDVQGECPEEPDAKKLWQSWYELKGSSKASAQHDYILWAGVALKN
ncbi:acyl-CoA-binding protein [Streptomyces sp. NPDC059008]|uniref:acyl-CoA-binding protein n=1 Tax=Streptomyces sp. NPDC059008 TaxID=3346693 RepID=UPI00369B1209